MPKKLAYLHTVPSLVTLFNDLSRQLFPPDVEVFHIADEMLLKVVLAQGGLYKEIYDLQLRDQEQFRKEMRFLEALEGG